MLGISESDLLSQHLGILSFSKSAPKTFDVCLFFLLILDSKLVTFISLILSSFKTDIERSVGKKLRMRDNLIVFQNKAKCRLNAESKKLK